MTMRSIILSLSLLSMTVVASSCTRVELAPEEQHTLLPLAIGNSWDYIDSIFISHSIDGLDTFTLETHMEITNEIYCEYDEDPSAKYHPRRLNGWEISESTSTDDQKWSSALFVLDGDLWVGGMVLGLFGTTFTSGMLEYNLGAEFSCQGLNQSFTYGVDRLATSSGMLYKVMEPKKPQGYQIQHLPYFHHQSACFETAFGEDWKRNYFVTVTPLLHVPGQVSVTVPAGTFNCEDFQSQQWAEGVGMVQGILSGSTSFVEEDGSTSSGNIVWKRVLKSYHLE